MRYLSLLAVFLCLHPLRADEPRRPNVVLFLIDDLGRQDLGCYGSKFYRTPNIDRLAADGMKFTDYYAACPVCSPTRASILTGRYPSRYNITDFISGRPDRPDQKLLRPKTRTELPLEEITLAKVLKSQGYATAHIGKWHLGGKGFEPEKQGFDLNIAGDQTGSPISYFAPFQNKEGRFMPGLEKAEPGEYLTDRLTTEAEKFIDANAKKPFFLYFPHYAVHIPLRAKEEILKKYPGKLEFGRQSNPLYAAMIESVDESVGRILKKLEDMKLTDDTIVIFTSDNGGLSVLEGADTPATINAPFREGKGYLYEGGIRVPLLVKWRGKIKAGSTSATPTCSIDLFPSLLETAGAKSEAKVDGLSLVSLWKGGDALKRDALYWHYPHYSNQGGKPSSAIRAGEWKMIEFFENGRKELFNVAKDLGEGQNLAPSKPEIVAELSLKLDAWRKEVDAQLPKANPDYRPNPPDKDGKIVMHARTAEVFGTQLRYEPLPHKTTLGFWVVREDYATFEFTVTEPGKFRMEILQGCGKGSGGSEVEFAVGEQKLTTIVEDTGGFQNFKSRDIGTLIVEKAGRQTLTVRAKTKPGVAVMDLRQVTLHPVVEK